MPGDYQGSLSVQAIEDDEGEGVMPGMECRDYIKGSEPAADLQVAPTLAPAIITNGISVALLAIASGVAIASDGKGGMRVAQNIQPVGINRPLLNAKVTKAFTDGHVADTYRGKNPKETHESHNFTFLACVCEWDRLHQLHPVAPTFGPNNLLGEPKARLITWDDVRRLSKVLLETDIKKTTGPPEEGLVSVLKLVNIQYNSFQKVKDFQDLLRILCGKLNGITMEELKCSGIDDVCFLVKIAWASLKLPILGAVSGQTRMLAASHVLQDIEPSNDGKNCVRKKKYLQILNGETPSSLHSTTAQVEFLVVTGAGGCLTEDTVELINAQALQQQGVAMRGTALSLQEIVLQLVDNAKHDVGKESSRTFGRQTFISMLQLPVGILAKRLMTLSTIEGVPIKALTIAHAARSPDTTLSKSVSNIHSKTVLSRHKEPAWSELLEPKKRRSSIRSVKVEFFASLVGIEIADTIAKSPYQALWDFFQHDGSSHSDSAWQQQQLIGVWMHPAKPSETGEYVGEWVQKIKEEATGIWWVSPSTLEIKDCELSWTLILEAGLLRPLASLLTTGLLQQVVCPHIMERSMGLYESIVREWVYAFLWEVLVWSEGFAVPIPAAWKDLPNLRELLAVVYKDELGLVTWVSQALERCEGQKDKIFCTNLFGIVAFILGLLRWKDSGYSLSSSFTQSLHGQCKEKGKEKGLLAPECFRVSCPLVVNKFGGKELSLFQWVQELLGNSDASNELANKFDKEYLCDWKVGEKLISRVAGLFGKHDNGPDIKKTFFEQGLKQKTNVLLLQKTNVLLLGMTQAAAEVAALVNPGDKRDLARCVAIEEAFQVNVFTVSKAQKSGVTQNSKRHLQADFAMKNFISELKTTFGAEIVFDQVALDYVWMPDPYFDHHLTKAFYNTILPNLASLLTNRGQIFLPCLPCICLKLMEANAKLKQNYEITFREKEDLADHFLWTASKTIDDETMHKEYGKGPKQLEQRCSNLVQRLLKSSSTQVTADEIRAVFGSLQEPLFVCLRRLGQEEEGAKVGGIKALTHGDEASRLNKKRKSLLKLRAAENKKKNDDKEEEEGDEEQQQPSLEAKRAAKQQAKEQQQHTQDDSDGDDDVDLLLGGGKSKKAALDSDEEDDEPKEKPKEKEKKEKEENEEEEGRKEAEKKRKKDENERTKEAEKKKEEKEEKGRKEAEKKRKKDENEEEEGRKKAGKKRKKDENERTKEAVEASRTSNSHPETPQVGGDAGTQGPTKTRATESRLTLEDTTVIYPEPRLPKGEMLVAPCCEMKFEKQSPNVKFRTQCLSAELKVYVCDYVPVQYLQALTEFHETRRFQKEYKEGKKKITPYDIQTSVKEKKNYDETNKAANATYFHYLEKRLNKKNFSMRTKSKSAYPLGVTTFLADVSRGLNEVTGNASLNGDLEIHGLCIETVKPAHQRGHIDHESSYEMEKRSFVGHMPLDQEGIVLRLDNISSEMRQCLLQKEYNLDEKVDVVDDILYIHVPFGSILVIDDRTFHGGHYGSPEVKRFHFVVSPWKWKNEEQDDALVFLREAARHHTKKWREKMGEWECGGWEESDDPTVAEPKLPLDTLKQMIEKIGYQRRNAYYESFLEYCYPQSTLDHLNRVSNLIPDYIPQVFKGILSTNAEILPRSKGNASSPSSSSSSSSSSSP